LKTTKILLVGLFIALLSSCQPPNRAAHPRSQAPQIRVLIGEISGTDSLRFDGNYTLSAPEAKYELMRSSVFYLRTDSKGYRLYNDKRLFMLRGNDKIVLEPQSGQGDVFYKQKYYSGTLSIIMAENGKIWLVNSLPLDSYLRSVVPSEIFTHKVADLEAIKAQAVCARSYALLKMKQRANQDFDVYGDVRDQAYNGRKVQSPLGNTAVDQTRGSVLMYQGKIAKTYFHACDGGLSEAPQNVWPGISEPYLQVKQDVWVDSFACKDAPVFRWQKSFSIGQLDSLFEQMFHVSYQDSMVSDTTLIPFKISIKQRSTSGRVQQIQINYGRQSQGLSGFDIRRFFSGPDGKKLPSTLFKLSLSDSLLIINGAGHGHGVGLCQYGALYKAENGLKYYHILRTYFPGTNLEKVY